MSATVTHVTSNTKRYTVAYHDAYSDPSEWSDKY